MVKKTANVGTKLDCTRSHHPLLDKLVEQTPTHRKLVDQLRGYIGRGRGPDKFPKNLKDGLLVGWVPIADAFSVNVRTLRNWCEFVNFEFVRVGRRPVLPKQQVPLLFQRFYWSKLTWKETTALRSLIKVVRRPELEGQIRLTRIRGRRALRQT